VSIVVTEQKRTFWHAKVIRVHVRRSSRSWLLYLSLRLKSKLLLLLSLRKVHLVRNIGKRSVILPSLLLNLSIKPNVSESNCFRRPAERTVPDFELQSRPFIQPEHIVQQLTFTRPDDWHLHLRDGALMQSVLPDTARQFARAIVMPNLRPPVTTTEEALAYRARIIAALPAGAK